MTYGEIYRYSIGALFTVFFIIVILQGQIAQRRLVKSEQAAQRDRLQILEELKRRQEEQDAELKQIQAEIQKNTGLTVAAAQASAKAAEVANHMNEKIVTTHDSLMQAVVDMVKAPMTTEISLRNIDENTAAIKVNTEAK